MKYILFCIESWLFDWIVPNLNWDGISFNLSCYCGVTILLPTGNPVLFSPELTYSWYAIAIIVASPSFWMQQTFHGQPLFASHSHHNYFVIQVIFLRSFNLYKYGKICDLQLNIEIKNKQRFGAYFMASLECKLLFSSNYEGNWIFKSNYSEHRIV